MGTKVEYLFNAYGIKLFFMIGLMWCIKAFKKLQDFKFSTILKLRQ